MQGNVFIKLSIFDVELGCNLSYGLRVEDFAKFVKKRRESLGMSKRNLAKLCNVSGSTITRIENGELLVTNIFTRTLLTLCKKLQIYDFEFCIQ